MIFLKFKDVMWSRRQSTCSLDSAVINSKRCPWSIGPRRAWHVQYVWMVYITTLCVLRKIWWKIHISFAFYITVGVDIMPINTIHDKYWIFQTVQYPTLMTRWVTNTMIQYSTRNDMGLFFPENFGFWMERLILYLRDCICPYIINPTVLHLLNDFQDRSKI